MTIDAAWQCRTDHLVGSLEAGKRADLVVLEEDPTTVEPSTIHAIRVVETWMDGRRRYAA